MVWLVGCLVWCGLVCYCLVGCFFRFVLGISSDYLLVKF